MLLFLSDIKASFEPQAISCSYVYPPLLRTRIYSLQLAEGADIDYNTSEVLSEKDRKSKRYQHSNHPCHAR